MGSERWPAARRWVVAVALTAPGLVVAPAAPAAEPNAFVQFEQGDLLAARFSQRVRIETEIALANLLSKATQGFWTFAPADADDDFPRLVVRLEFEDPHWQYLLRFESDSGAARESWKLEFYGPAESVVGSFPSSTELPDEVATRLTGHLGGREGLAAENEGELFKQLQLWAPLATQADLDERELEALLDIAYADQERLSRSWFRIECTDTGEGDEVVEVHVVGDGGCGVIEGRELPVLRANIAQPGPEHKPLPIEPSLVSRLPHLRPRSVLLERYKPGQSGGCEPGPIMVEEPP